MHNSLEFLDKTATLIPSAVIIRQACYRSQACQAKTHIDLGCMGQEQRQNYYRAS